MSLEVDIAHRLSGFSLEARFEAGPGVTALFGRSGAGKTTVVNAVAGLLSPQKGRIAIDGDVVLDTGRGINLPIHRRGLGYVFQDARLFPHLTARQNLHYGARFARGVTRISEDEVIDLLGIEDLLDRRPARLSGGERQRVAIGRALLAQPRMLLMDEPLAALDAPRKQDILPYLERLKSEARIPILYVSHALDEIARLADTMVLLQNGAVAATGPLFDIMADPEAMPLLGAREAGAVIEVRVVETDDGGLSTLQAAAGRIELPGVTAPPGTELRLRILAQDIILSKTRPDGLVGVNILPVTIKAVHPGGGPGAAILLDAAGDRLLARVTARTLETLDLIPGQPCFAILKAMAIAPGAVGRA